MLIHMQLEEILTSNRGFIVVLGEEDHGERQLVIEIGPNEAQALEWAVHDVEAPRPLTHDLVLNCIQAMDGTLERVLVDHISKDENRPYYIIFHGKLDVRKGDGSSVWIDTRPSDAMVIATKTGVPIFVEEEVLETAGSLRPPETPDNFFEPGEGPDASFGEDDEEDL